MSEETDTTARADRTSMNYTKDAYGISPLATLSSINLNNKKVAAQYYEDTRTAMMRRLQMVDGLYDLAYDFGSKSDGTVPWGANKKVKLKVYNNMGDKVGTTRPVQPIDRLTARLHVQNIMLAHLPPDTSWYREINAADPKAPIFTWFAKKDAFYLAPTRSGIHQSQSRYFGYRWRTTMDLSEGTLGEDITFKQFSLWLVWIPFDKWFDYRKKEPYSIADRTVADRIRAGPHWSSINISGILEM